LAQRAKGKLRSKMPELERALEGDFRKEHAFLVKRLLMQTRFLENQEQALRRAIQSRLTPPERQAVALWDTIPGVNEAVAWTLVAESELARSNSWMLTIWPVGSRCVPATIQVVGSGIAEKSARAILGCEPR
jgi:transposase